MAAMAAPRDRPSGVAAEQHGTGRRETAAAHDRDLSAGNLTFAALAPKLDDRLVQQTHAVRPPGGELSPVGIEGHQATFAGDGSTAVEEILRLTDPAKAESFEP
jgi:hypothetical protein